MNIYRQGDVLIIAVESLPEDLKPVERKNGRVILAEGEITGHAHAIVDLDAYLLTQEVTGQLYLDCPAPVEVVHEEHDTVALPAGQFVVYPQVEYTPRGLRRVLD